MAWLPLHAANYHPRNRIHAERGHEHHDGDMARVVSSYMPHPRRPAASPRGRSRQADLHARRHAADAWHGFAARRPCLARIRLLDEAMHLASGIQVIGYRHVLGAQSCEVVRSATGGLASRHLPMKLCA